MFSEKSFKNIKKNNMKTPKFDEKTLNRISELIKNTTNIKDKIVIKLSTENENELDIFINDFSLKSNTADFTLHYLA